MSCGSSPTPRAASGWCGHSRLRPTRTGSSGIATSTWTICANTSKRHCAVRPDPRPVQPSTVLARSRTLCAGSAGAAACAAASLTAAARGALPEGRSGRRDSRSDRTKGCCYWPELKSAPHHDQFAELDAHRSCAPEGELLTIKKAAVVLGVAPSTIHRLLNDGIIAGEQPPPGAPWRIRLTKDLQDRFNGDAGEDFLPMREAMRALGVSRQTVLHRVKRGELAAVHVMRGKQKGLRIKVIGRQPGLFDPIS